MPIDYGHVMGLTETATICYHERDTMLYALGIGFGRDPLDERELNFVYEDRALKTVPTMACLFAGARGIMTRSGIDVRMVVHGEQHVKRHGHLPPAGTVTAHTKVLACIDKGEAKGAILVVETVIADAAGGGPIAAATASIFCRADGGFGGPAQGGPALHAIPPRACELEVESPTRADQALLYRLSGDHNPLHADPRAAREAGFPAPILHGLCSYGIVCRALLKHECDYDPGRLGAFGARFTSPVMPGETIVTEIWRDAGILSFRSRVKERGEVVLNNGYAVVT